MSASTASCLATGSKPIHRQPSLLPDSILQLSVQLDAKNYVSRDGLKSVKMFCRAADYVAVAMITLNHNVPVERDMTHDDIESRLLDSWGACPGLVYAHTGLDTLEVVGPGQTRRPTILSCLWLENSLSTFYPKNARDYKGLHKLVASFSVPGGFPRSNSNLSCDHINAGTPGADDEGGELGHALGVSFRAVVENPDLVVVCVVGTATAWHGFKYIDPCGFKISERTIYGTMDNKELTALFTGYGYQVRLVEDIDNDLAASMDWALAERRLKPPPAAATLSSNLCWPSYRLKELFTADGVSVPEVLSIIPEDSDKLREWKDFCVEPGTQESCMKAVGRLLKGAVKENPQKFRIFSPDELVSNKLDVVFDESGHDFKWHYESRGMLQGHTLTGRNGQALLLPNPSFILTLFLGLFPSYEAFLGIVQTVVVQYCKFTKMSAEIPWRQPCGSLDYLETSTWVRQEHNGFSHRNPAFIGAVLNHKPIAAHVYLPPDANCFLSTMAHCLRAQQATDSNMHCVACASVWKFASVDDGVNPDVVLVGIGVKVTSQVIAAAALLRDRVPELRVRVVKLANLMILSATGSYPHAPTDVAFDSLFTHDKPIHFDYHGYRKGTTTLAFNTMLCNHISRYDVAAAPIRGGALCNPRVAVSAHEHESSVKHLAIKKDYIYANGKDRENTFDTPTFPRGA
ncbi:phosphoketolase [Mycena maculata]|uniref:Phosphoketolase n=1 Tax=Mycena maculata TaxID=230809 RepID=A0AAD7IYH3_9AGAR|nr:phosphoketolase [Mycena maculata]